MNGNVVIGVGNRYAQIGGNVVAPQGDIDIQAKKVDKIISHEASAKLLQPTR